MSNNWTAFSKSRDVGEQEDEEVIAVVSPSRVNLQKAYETLCVSRFFPNELPSLHCLVGGMSNLEVVCYQHVHF
jgi:hypothetical protein